MPRSFNFSAGPATLPEAVLQRVREELLDHRGLGASVMEISHRSPAFDRIAESTEDGIRRLMGLDPSSTVVFTCGGATQQFSVIPAALARSDCPGVYEVHGHWGHKAVAAARALGLGEIVSETTPQQGIAPFAQWHIPENAAYLHLTSNETIDGVQFQQWPETDLPVVVDMSSDILSRQMDYGRFDLVYASAQKNLGPSGITVVVVSEQLMDRLPDDLPPLQDWRLLAQSGSRLNTPATFPWYVLGLVLEWIETEGGIAAIEARNRGKAEALYAAVDGSDFYRNDIPPPVRSQMNIPFHLADERLTGRFVEQADAAGLIGLKGHRAVGGLRASIYNAMPEAGVARLIEFMREFERNA